MKRICYYHAGCPDGFGAAWAAWRSWGDQGRFVARGHEDRVDPRTIEGAEVVFVDIAPQNDELLELADVASQITVLDHHITAQERFVSDLSLQNEIAGQGHLIHFDLEHSGAMLSWLHFHPDERPPDLLRFVEDQDLWSWKLPRSEEVNAAIASYPLEFNAWDALAARSAESLAAEGEPIVRINAIEINRAVQTARPIALPQGRIEAVNAQRCRSSIGHELAQRAAYQKKWGLVYRVTGERVDVSIYSIDDLDVSTVARHYGGGGHRNASGFTVTLKDWLDLLV